MTTLAPLAPLGAISLPVGGLAPGTSRPSPPPSLPDLPASAHVVYGALASRGALTAKDLLAATGMPARTVRYAISRLRDARLVDHRFNLADARQSYYFVAECPGACALAPPRRVL